MHADAGERSLALRTALDRAISIYEQGMLDRALELNVEIAREFPEDPESLFNQGVVFERMGMKEESVQRYRKSLERDPYFHQSALNLCSILFEKGDLRAAGALLASTLPKDLPEWIRERLEDVQDKLVTAALDRLSAQVLRADVGEGAKEAGECISAITGRDYSGCRIEETDKGHEYVLEHDGCTFRARIEGESYRELVVCKDPYGDEVYRKEMLVMRDERGGAAVRCGSSAAGGLCECAAETPEDKTWCCDNASMGEPCACPDSPAPWEDTGAVQEQIAADAPAPWEAVPEPPGPLIKTSPQRKTAKKTAKKPAKAVKKSTPKKAARPAGAASKTKKKAAKKAARKPAGKSAKKAARKPAKPAKKTARPAKKTVKKGARPVKKTSLKKAPKLPKKALSGKNSKKATKRRRNRK